MTNKTGLEFTKDDVMPTPMTIEMEVTKTPENVTCENLSNADERQAALDAFDQLTLQCRPFSLEESEQYQTIRAALQSPRVPDAPTVKENLTVQNWVTLFNESKDTLVVKLNDKEIIRTFYVSGEIEVNHSVNVTDILSPRVPVIDAGVMAMLETVNANPSAFSHDALVGIISRAYAELQKGV